MITSDNLPLSIPTIGVYGSIEPHPAEATAGDVRRYICLALSENTRRAYQADLRDFLAWGGVLPATDEVLARYIAARAPSHSPYSITRRVVGICRAHTSLGFESPARSELIRAVLRGVRRRHGRPQRQARPLLKQALLELVAQREGVAGVRNRALLLVGFAAALRRSELVALNVDDLLDSQDGLVVHIRRSKTDQDANGRKVALPFGRTSVCPVAALKAWLTDARIESGPVFRSVTKSGQVRGRLSAQSVSLIVKRCAKKAGLDDVGFSGHSLRSGFVTSATHAGAAVHKIQAQTGHRSIAMLSRYIRDAELFLDNACAAVL